jgi:hypothetical protein
MKMVIHVLPGDATAADFVETGIGGETVICREALIDGDVKAESLDEFWKLRENFIAGEYGANERSYHEIVTVEFERLRQVPADAEVNLWFEYELFCSVNMWFCIDLLKDADVKVFRVAPATRTDEEKWKGFGKMSPDDLRRCFAERTEMKAADRELGKELWQAFSNDDMEKLDRLGDTRSESFPHLREVCTAAMQRSFRPAEILKEITSNGAKDLSEIFQEFSRRAGVYGFGDTQVKRLIDGQISAN